MIIRFKRVLAFCMALMMAVVLCACGGSMNAELATELVQGNLDVIYLGKSDPSYLKLVDSTEKEIEEIYISGLETEAEVFAYYFDIEYLTNEVKSDIVDLYKNIYAKTKYIVNDATELGDDAFAVKVQVEPLDIFQLVNDDFDSAMAPFWEKYGDVDVYSMTDEEYQAYDTEWAMMIIDLCRDKLADMGYMEEKSIVIQVEKDENGVWTMSDDDFYNFDEIVVYYPSL